MRSTSIKKKTNLRKVYKFYPIWLTCPQKKPSLHKGFIHLWHFIKFRGSSSKYFLSCTILPTCPTSIIFLKKSTHWMTSNALHLVYPLSNPTILHSFNMACQPENTSSFFSRLHFWPTFRHIPFLLTII